jgi:tellurite resistance protein TerC
MTESYLLWLGFGAFVLVMLALDLGVFHRKAHVVSFREALGWTAVWVTLATLFGAGIWRFMGAQKGLEFFTGYLIEYSLSADNVFVFALLFKYFRVPPQWQHKVLFWGILGALAMRLIMIGAGVALISRFGWILYIFGAFLIYTGVKMVFDKGEDPHPEDNPIIRWFERVVPVVKDYHEDRFFVRAAGRLVATPLMVVLICVEVTDLIFAVDSIPAIFAVTLDPFIIYTSNVFAIMGLRSLYFVLGGMMDMFHYLKLGLGAVLTFVGVKMLLGHTAWKIDTTVALLVVAGILATAILASIIYARRHPNPPASEPESEKPEEITSRGGE